jgi:hypothetical protein
LLAISVVGQLQTTKYAIPIGTDLAKYVLALVVKRILNHTFQGIQSSPLKNSGWYAVQAKKGKSP